MILMERISRLASCFEKRAWSQVDMARGVQEVNVRAAMSFLAKAWRSGVC